MLKLQEKILNLVTIDSTDIAIKYTKFDLGGLMKTKNQTDNQKEAIKKLTHQYKSKIEEFANKSKDERNRILSLKDEESRKNIQSLKET